VICHRGDDSPSATPRNLVGVLLSSALLGGVRPERALVFVALSASVLYGGLVSGYTARLAGYHSTGGVLTMGREVRDMVSDFGSEEWRCSSLATPPDSWQYT
jgi:hypothetical protein